MYKGIYIIQHFSYSVEFVNKKVYLTVLKNTYLDIYYEIGNTFIVNFFEIPTNHCTQYSKVYFY